MKARATNPIVGLTGGIASGKSSVGRILMSLGAGLVDADAIAREVVLPGMPALAEIRGRFGDEVIQSDGSLDRKRLGALVFADPAARLDLNAITHPRIAQRSQELVQELVRQGHRPVIYEAALIVENQLHRAMAALIVVSLPEAQQLVRLVARDALSADEALARIRAQAPIAEKVAAADYVIDNSGTLPELATRTEQVWQELQKRF